MYKLMSILAAVILGVSCACAQLPPIIDRELFFGDPQVSGGQISPDGSFVSFLKPFKSVRNIWVKETHAPFDQARPITADTSRPVTQYFWSRDSRLILYAQDKGGDENYRIYAVDPKGTGDPVPAARDLTPLSKVRAYIYDVPRKKPGEIIIGLNDRKPELHDVYRLDLATGDRTLLWKNDQNVAGWSTDLDGNLRLGIRQTDDGGTEILRIDKDSLVSIYRVNSEESCGPLQFRPDGQQFYFETNKGSKLDKTELNLFDLKTGKTSFVDKDPLGQVDLGSAWFSDVTDELLATFYVGDRTRVYPKQKQFGEDWKKLLKALPEGEKSIAGATADEKTWVVWVSSDIDPGSLFIYDRTTGKAELFYHGRPDLPTQYLAHMTPVRYKGRDGLTIPAYLTLPKGLAPKNLPVAIVVHGGPWGRDYWGYNSTAQFLANRGYAVLMPNFRGSAGFGKKFLNAGNKQWGTGFMQHDITDGVKYLVGKKIADPKRVGIFGGSYGGYATLAGLAFTPDLYAAGVSYVGPSNIITLLKTIPPYWAPIKKIFAVRVGDLDNPKDVAMLEKQSPLNSAKSIKAPLLVIQGANDPRVKKAESDQIVVALRDLHRTVGYLVAPDEGHGFAGRENRMAAYTALEKFFSEHLGGRFQDSIAPDINKKLTDITVDVSTVTMPVRDASGAVAPPIKFAPERLLRVDSLKYVTTFTAMGQKITVNTLRKVAPVEAAGRTVWRIIEVSSGMMGSGADTIDLDATSLYPTRWSATMGSGSVNITFGSEGVTGNMSRGAGVVIPINVKGEGPIATEGPALEIALPTVDLSEGYRSSVNIYAIMENKIRMFALFMAGTETVTTPAGTFDSYIVQATPTDGEAGNVKFWITKDRKCVVRTETALPAAMGGGTATMELVQ